MSDVEFYNRILKQVSDRIAEALVEFQAELEIQRLEKDRAISRAEINQRKADTWRVDYEALKQAYDRLEENYHERGRWLGDLRLQVARLEKPADVVDDTRLSRRYTPHYTGTACIHGLHEQCKRTCKTCGALCLCEARDCPCRKARTASVEDQMAQIGQAYIEAHPEVNWDENVLELELNGGDCRVVGHKVMPPILRDIMLKAPTPPEAEPIP